MTIFSVLESGSLILPATSGRMRTIISMTAASLYCLNDSAFSRIASAVALPCASMIGGFGQTARLVRFGFGETGGFGDVGVGKTFGLGGGGRAGGFGFELEFRGVGQRLDFVTLGVGGLLHVGFEFALLAQDFLLLQFDLLLLLDDVAPALLRPSRAGRSCISANRRRGRLRLSSGSPPPGIARRSI